MFFQNVMKVHLSPRSFTSFTEAMKHMSMLQTKQNQEGKDGQNKELTTEIFEAKKENLTANEIIVSSGSESTEKEPIFYNFIPIPEIDQLQVSQENVFATKTHHESEEVSTELKLGYGSCITNKRKESEKLAISSLSCTACEIKRMKLGAHWTFGKEAGPNVVSLDLKLGFDPWVIKKKIALSDISQLLLPEDLVRKHILPQWDARLIESVNNGVRVAVWDCDTKSEHPLIFKNYCGGYVLIRKWNKNL